MKANEIKKWCESSIRSIRMPEAIEGDVENLTQREWLKGYLKGLEDIVKVIREAGAREAGSTEEEPPPAEKLFSVCWGRRQYALDAVRACSEEDARRKAKEKAEFENLHVTLSWEMDCDGMELMNIEVEEGAGESDNDPKPPADRAREGGLQ